jgi:hypothetical protein
VALGDGDIAWVLSDLKALGEAVDVVLGATTVQGILRQNQEVLSSEGQQVERVNVVEIKAGLAGLVIGAALTVGGVSYTVRDVVPPDDAGMVGVVLAG